MSWHSIHIHYYDENMDDLILDAVRPALREISGRVEAAFYTRHWKRGPHVRLNARTDDHGFSRVVWPAADQIIGGFLAAHPSTTQIDSTQHLPMHQRLADLENEPGPLVPWYPNNSIHVAEYDPRLQVLGGSEMSDLLADFYVDTTELAFQMTEQAQGPRRNAAAFDVLIATAHSLSGMGIERGFISFRSHAEAFLCGLPEGEGLRSAWDNHYRSHAAALADRIHAITATLDGERQTVPFITEWVSKVAPYRRRVTQLGSQSKFFMPWSDADAESKLDSASTFHRKLFRSQRWKELQHSDKFLAYRILLNYTYLHLTRFGITPAERFQICHLAANSVEDCFGVSALELIGQDGAEL